MAAHDRTRLIDLLRHLRRLPKGPSPLHEKIAVPIERYPVDLDADVTYAQVPGWLGRTTRDLKLSVMRPLGVEGPLPCLVWFCGGGWMDCDRNVHLPNLVDIVRAGYVVASAEYRDSNKGDFPMPLEDAKAAVRYLRANAGRWDIDASKIGVAGESAGGHQACLLGVTGDVERFDVGAHLDQTSRVQAVVDYYGVVSPLTAKRDNASHAFDFVYRNLLGAEQSGFIADIGFETYQKIMNEAIAELRAEGLHVEGLNDSEQEVVEQLRYIDDAHIEIEVEAGLPDSYVAQQAERLKLYRELDSTKDEEALLAFG